MMLSRFVPMGLLFTVCFVFPSCNGFEEKTSTEMVSSNLTAVAAEPTSTSTPVINPQVMMMVKHRVGNYAKWKISYDAHDSLRLVHGLHNYVIGRALEDSNMVLVALKGDDLAKAKSFARDPSLKQAMQKGGVIGAPTPMILTMVWQDTASLDAIRSMVTMTVKDWPTWQKAFEEGRNERLQNGISDRIYGYDADNQTKVTVVTALTDTAKAYAYWKSDMLKIRRAASGAIGEPVRFLFHIVERY